MRPPAFGVCTSSDARAPRFGARAGRRRRLSARSIVRVGVRLPHRPANHDRRSASHCQPVSAGLGLPASLCICSTIHGLRAIGFRANGRYNAAYMINWKSNVFPGILGRACDRPCEPACRRRRLEEQPVAICRLKRVAADHKHDIAALLPRERPDPLTNLVSQRMGIHEWSYDNAITLDRRFKVPHVTMRSMARSNAAELNGPYGRLRATSLI